MKEEIVNFDFEKVCFELKVKVLIFYVFLMISVCNKKENFEWFFSVVVVGLVLFK